MKSIKYVETTKWKSYEDKVKYIFFLRSTFIRGQL